MFSIFASKGAQRDQKVTRATLMFQECCLTQGSVIRKERTLIGKMVVDASTINLFLHTHRDATAHDYGKIKKNKTKRENGMPKQGAISSLLAGNENEKIR